jgi:hypothetical protein
MKLEIKVKELNHDDLVNFFSTALYGNHSFDCRYSNEARNAVYVKNDCYEDIIAKILLNGGSVDIVDMLSEKGDKPYSDNARWDEGIGYFVYPISLKDVLKGLNKASKNKYDNKRVMNFIQEDYDMIDADVLLQYVCYGEIIYG